jgi:hypothetical protein
MAASDGTSEYTMSATGAIDINNWHHVEFVYNRSTNISQAYVDGKVSGSPNTLNFTGSINCSVVTGGANTIGASNGGNEFKGLIDDFKIYNYARTPAQIAWDYNRGKPIAHWKMDECQGISIKDWSGNRNNGTLTLGASGQTSAGTCVSNADTAWYNGRNGKFGASLNLDGINDQVNLGNPAIINGLANSNQITVTGWINMNALDNKIQTIAQKGADEHYGFWLGPDIRNHTVWWEIGDGSASFRNCAPGFKFGSGIWYHLTGTYNGSQSKVYVNGKLLTTCTYNLAMVFDNNDLLLGRDILWNSNSQLDDVRIYNYALTAEQVKQVMNEGSAVRFGP